MKTLSFLKNVCWLFILTITPVFSQGYEISISIKSKSDTVILGHFFARNSTLISDDTIILKNGKGVFKGKKNLEKGVYFIYTDKKKYDILIGNEQKFGVVVDTSDFANKTRFTSSVENDVFFEFQRYNAARNQQWQQLSEQMKTVTTEQEKQNIHTQMQTLYRERNDYIRKLADGHPELYVSKFLKTLIPVDAPEVPKDAEGRIIDSLYMSRLYQYRARFFDNFNIYDPELLRTPNYEDKLLEFIGGWFIPQHPDTICAVVDKILAKTQGNDAMFRCVWAILWNHYTSSKVVTHENVWVHLAAKWYIPYASWASADDIGKIKKEVEKRTPNLVGKPAPPIEMLMVLPPEHFKAAMLDTAIKNDLHAGSPMNDFRKTVKSKYTVLFFWDYNCGHCKQAILELFKVYEEYKSKGLQVITLQEVNTKEAKNKWIDYVNEHNLFGWIDAWSPYSNKWRDLYNVSSFPTLYLLDEHGTIISKNIGIDHIKEFIIER